jgi:hypothetical protein
MVMAAMLASMAGFGVLLALLLVGLKCDESCDNSEGEWWHAVDAWQWTGQLVVALLGAASICAAFVAVKRRRYRTGTALMVLAAASFGAWAAFLAPMGDGLGI